VATIGGANPQYKLDAEDLELITQPLQFIWGANDVFGNLDVARQATNIIPNALLHEMQTGHLPFLDQPEETGTVIREFLGAPQNQHQNNNSPVSSSSIKMKHVI
jgi:pimeloyl-ACP methyl ester carboxylesterase